MASKWSGTAKCVELSILRPGFTRVSVIFHGLYGGNRGTRAETRTVAEAERHRHGVRARRNERTNGRSLIPDGEGTIVGRARATGTVNAQNSGWCQ